MCMCVWLLGNRLNHITTTIVIPTVGAVVELSEFPNRRTPLRVKILLVRLKQLDIKLREDLQQSPIALRMPLREQSL